jgi:hypothetical protein
MVITEKTATNTGEDVSQKGPSYMLVGMQSSATTVEISMEVSQKLKIDCLMTLPHLGHIPFMYTL